MEGNACRPTGADAGLITVLPASECSPPQGLMPPIHVYRQGQGVSVTAGFSYRGTTIPALDHTFVFGDFSLGKVFSIDLDDPTAQPGYLFDGGSLITSFAQSLDGEIYFFDWYFGTLSKLEAIASANTKPPVLLTDTGCVDAVAPLLPATGGLPYSVQAQLGA